MGCNCCNLIMKGANINHSTTGKEIKLVSYATCVTNFVVYVGKTIRSVNTRIKEHKNDICNFQANTYTDNSVSRHFANAKHNACQLKWKVLEVVTKSPEGGDRDTQLLQS
ncbi:hypothetical protein XELAEV_18011455mg [Xenopus laevis]|uniref:GIY-YIG domain-containing protein n=1 Tax=Xenopus laevis TaxID=8355 RepID=A0A974HXC4_XENLA|nr:hypothetical protein XELAEV_18011455mg [Xenopus laevis]